MVRSGPVITLGTLIVLGDGDVSLDSRLWGYVPVERVLGVVICRLPQRSDAR